MNAEPVSRVCFNVAGNVAAREKHGKECRAQNNVLSSACTADMLHTTLSLVKVEVMVLHIPSQGHIFW